jgi:hypothetical protein
VKFCQGGNIKIQYIETVGYLDGGFWLLKKKKVTYLPFQRHHRTVHTLLTHFFPADLRTNIRLGFLFDSTPSTSCIMARQNLLL